MQQLCVLSGKAAGLTLLEKYLTVIRENFCALTHRGHDNSMKMSFGLFRASWKDSLFGIILSSKQPSRDDPFKGNVLGKIISNCSSYTKENK